MEDDHSFFLHLSLPFPAAPKVGFQQVCLSSDTGCFSTLEVLADLSMLKASPKLHLCCFPKVLFNYVLKKIILA